MLTLIPESNAISPSMKSAFRASANAPFPTELLTNYTSDGPAGR